jgi:hypothetical protein
MRGFTRLPSQKGATRNTDGLLNLKPKPSRLEVRRNFFSNRVTDNCYKNPNAVKNVESMSAFKRCYKNNRAAMVTPTNMEPDWRQDGGADGTGLEVRITTECGHLPRGC